MKDNKAGNSPQQQKAPPPAYLTVERARELLNIKRPTIFEGMEEHMTPEEIAEMKQIEQDLNLKRDTHATILFIATAEHPAHKSVKTKASRKPKAAETTQENEEQLQQTWGQDDNHDPFADYDGDRET